MSFRRFRSGAIVLLVACLWIPNLSAWSDEMTSATTLPAASSFQASGWDGRNVYLFGGSGSSRSIYRYNPTTKLMTLMGAQLPGPIVGASLIFDGTSFYLFGGENGWASYYFTNQILRYNPSTDVLTVMAASIPEREGHGYTSAIYDGRFAYIFGGFANYWFDGIYRYDPQTDTIVKMSARLPTGRAHTAAVFDGRYAYVFGGESLGTGSNDEILRYDPSNDTLVTLASRLPARLMGMGAVWTGDTALLFGGRTQINHYDDYPYYYNNITRFDPASGSVSYMASTIGTARAGVASAWDGHQVALFGGWYTVTSDCGSYCYQKDDFFVRDVSQYKLIPGVPMGGQVRPGPGIGETTVYWSPPDYATIASPVTRYRIYRTRNNGSASESRLLAEVDYLYSSMSFSDSTCSLGYVCSYEVSAVNRFGEGPRASSILQTGVGWAP